MKIKNNFISIITLGNFNPSIINPEFLANQKIMTEQISGQVTPVMSVLESDNITLITELERFQIIHREVGCFEETPIVEIASKLFDILKYTPVTKQGLNFNVTIEDFSGSENLKRIFGNPRNLTNYLDQSSEYIFQINTVVNDDVERTTIINCGYKFEDVVYISIKLQKKEDDNISINYNYEVRDIDKIRDNVHFVKNAFQKVCHKFISFTKQLEI
ncbi:MAG: hypothetical protein KBH86_10220 [Syntrophorhabdus sp.]|nr:hypothetical protein [Syntrophorhabdus sp.]